MPRLSTENTILAREIIARYPLKKSALIPLLHLAQEQDGYVTEEAMEHLAELVEVAPAEVLGTCSFYEMFKREPVGKYVVNVCTNISCQLRGGEELLHHLEESLEVRAGNTTPDGMFTLGDVECIAACTEAPVLQVNYRYFNRITHDEADHLLADLRAGKRAHEVPVHGIISRVRQSIPADRLAGPALPDQPIEPPWLGGPGGPGGPDASAAQGEHPEPQSTETEQQSTEEQPDKPSSEVREEARDVETPPADKSTDSPENDTPDDDLTDEGSGKA